jgi:ribosome biogenesis GTPase A
MINIDKIREYTNSVDVEMVELGVSIIKASLPREEWIYTLYRSIEGSFRSDNGIITQYLPNYEYRTFTVTEDTIEVKHHSNTLDSFTYSYPYNLQPTFNAVNTTNTSTLIINGYRNGTTGSYSINTTSSQTTLGSSSLQVQPIPEVDVGD